MHTYKWLIITLFEINIGVWLVRCHVTSNKTVMTRPAELASFNVAHSDDAIIHEVAIMHEPLSRDTLKDLTLAGHVINITCTMTV